MYIHSIDLRVDLEETRLMKLDSMHRVLQCGDHNTPTPLHLSAGSHSWEDIWTKTKSEAAVTCTKSKSAQTRTNFLETKEQVSLELSFHFPIYAEFVKYKTTAKGQLHDRYSKKQD